MKRIALILFCSVPLFSWGQLDTISVDTSSIILEPDFVPIQLNGKWTWYDVINQKASDSIYISDFAQQESGFYSSYIVKDSTHWGILDLAGDTVCAFAYDSIIHVDNQLLTKFNGEWSYHVRNNSSGDSLIPVSFDSLYFTGVDLYLYNSNKTGLILRNGVVIQPEYDGIHHFSCTSRNNYERYYMSLNGSEYNLIDEFGAQLLPDGIWDLRCTEDGIFEFRRGNNPEYYIPYTEEIVDPNGRDIVFYGEWGYKIYNDDNSRSELYLSDGQVFKDQYDDYFLLANDFIAVRKNGKVGLTEDGIQLLGEIKYDQINPVNEPVQIGDSSVWYFKFYLNDSCGLMDQFGNELFGARYANILVTGDDDRFIVLERKLSGVVDRNGRTIIPIKYHQLMLQTASQLFIIEHNKLVGLFDYKGRIKAPIEYKGYRLLRTFSDSGNTDALLVLKKRGMHYFFNSKGFIDKSGFDHYNFSQDVLKTYNSSAISVFLFDKKGGIEERSNYPLYRNAVVEKNYYDAWGGVNSWAISELEENQKEGYYGLRYYQKHGFGVEPKYRTIREGKFGDVLGAVSIEKSQYDLTNELSLEVIGGQHHLKIGSGNTDAVAYFSSELPMLSNGSGDRYINRRANGGQFHAYARMGGTNFIDLTDKIYYSEMADFRQSYRKYFAGGEVEICSTDASNVSFYDYFNYLNSSDGCRVSPEIMKLILNAKVGVRFKNAQCKVLNASVFGVGKRYRKYESTESFEEYYFLNGSVFYEKPLNTKLGTLRLKYLPKDDEEEVKIDNVIEASCPKSLISNGAGVNVLAKIKKNRFAKVHVDYPNYFFFSDSIDFSYEAGRITRRIDSNSIRLITPSGEIIADSCKMIRYLKEERFGLLREEGWELIDKNGIRISDVWYAGVSEFKGGRAEFILKGGRATVLNSNAEELLPLPEPRVFLDDDHFYFASNPAQLIKRSSNVTDQPQDGEKYQAKGFFTSKKEGRTIVRRFGSINTLELKSVPSLKTFGSCLYFKKGKHIYAVDSNLIIKKFKKADRFRMVTPEIAWLEGKRDQLVDSDWNYISKLTKKQSFEMRGGDLIVLENDSVYQNFGSLKTIAKYPELKLSSLEVEVFSQNGKYGVRSGNEMILPLSYGWLSKINDDEYMTRTNSEFHLYDMNLKRIVEKPFDRYIETYKGNFVFFYKDQVYVLASDAKTVEMIR